MSKIIHVDLSSNKISYSNVEPSFENSGRSLVVSILKDKVKAGCDYLSEENCIVLSAGLLTGTQAPSTGRLTIGAKRSGFFDVRTINIAGPISQKIASLGISAIAIGGCSKNSGTILHIEEDSITLHDIPEIRYKSVSDTIGHLRELWGESTSIIGIGPGGESVLPIASIFSTYTEGMPSFYCARGGMGDIFGYKGIKAIAVTEKKLFKAPLKDIEAFRKASKKLGRAIVENPVCGGALPAYGSITLIQMMKQGIKFNMDTASVIEGKISSNKDDVPCKSVKINRTCAPNCVVGCLNRHKGEGEKAYSTPAESEAIAACRNIYNIEDNEFVSNFNKKCFEIGIDTLEFLFSCSMFLKAQGEVGAKGKLEELLLHVKTLTPIGRILGSTTKGIYQLYADNKELSNMITRPAHTEEAKFKLKLPNKPEGCENMNDKEYLYGFMAAMGNLGICLFTSFAILEHKDGIKLLSELVQAKTGESLEPSDIILKALNNLKKQKEWQESSLEVGIASYIPEFVKVLYRYFNDNLEK